MQVFTRPRSLSLVFGCCVIGRRDGGTVDQRRLSSVSVSLSFFPQLLNAGVHPSGAEERGIVSPTLEHGEMKWPLLSSLLPAFGRHHYALTNCKTPGLLKEGWLEERGLVASPLFWHLRQKLRRRRDFLHLGGRREYTLFALILRGIYPSLLHL